MPTPNPTDFVQLTMRINPGTAKIYMKIGVIPIPPGISTPFPFSKRSSIPGADNDTIIFSSPYHYYPPGWTGPKFPYYGKPWSYIEKGTVPLYPPIPQTPLPVPTPVPQPMTAGCLQLSVSVNLVTLDFEMCTGIAPSGTPLVTFASEGSSAENTGVFTSPFGATEWEFEYEWEV